MAHDTRDYDRFTHAQSAKAFSQFAGGDWRTVAPGSGPLRGWSGRQVGPVVHRSPGLRTHTARRSRRIAARPMAAIRKLTHAHRNR
jgi:hypothetical protein